MCYFSVPGLEGHDSIILYTTRVETMDMALYAYMGTLVSTLYLVPVVMWQY